MDKLKSVNTDVLNRLKDLSLISIFNLRRLGSGGFRIYTEGSVQSKDAWLYDISEKVSLEYGIISKYFAVSKTTLLVDNTLGTLLRT
jgi:hypothetical protein